MNSRKVRQIVLPLITAMIWGSSFVTQSLSAIAMICAAQTMTQASPLQWRKLWW